MTPVEQRLREAFDAAAGQIRPHPHARAENIRRLDRSRVRGGPVLVGTAAATAAVTVGTFAIGGSWSGHDRPTGPERGGSASASQTQTPPPRPRSTAKPPGPDEYLMKLVPPTTGILRLEPPGSDETSFVWFGRGKRVWRNARGPCGPVVGQEPAGASDRSRPAKPCRSSRPTRSA